ncbi:MAG TPA: serine hydrolase domain-containing protein, partial [Clostridia bacterium]|nr:serine hydrolase domain-containing protein [Clostridia bacterium]
MKRKPLRILLWTLVAGLLAAGGALAETSGVLEHPDWDQIDRYIESQMADCRIPGFSLGIVRDGELLYMKGYGRADDTGRAVTPQTPFLIGSVSKSITAMAVMQLVEAGRIGLDDPVQTYLPGFALADERASGAITVRMLLNHTSGIPEQAEFQVATLRGDDETMGELIAKFKAIRPIGQPGARFAYGNANYIILGALIEQVSGMTYDAYIRQYIFEPLEMRHSYASAVDAAKDGLATGYRP